MSKWFSRNLTWDLIMVSLLLVFSVYFGYLHIIGLEPQSVHTWRQADSVSFTWNFYKNTWNPFAPEINNLLYKGDGKVAVEFPGLYWLGGMLSRLFGYNVRIPRMINILVVMMGLFAFYRLTWATLRDRFWAIMAPLFLFTSPLLVFYTNNFLPDAPALGMNLIGWALFFGAIQRGSFRWFMAAVAVQCFAALLKASAGISLVAMGAIWFMEAAAWVQWRDKPFFGGKWYTYFGVFVIGAALTAGWYVYAAWYSTGLQAEHWSPLIQYSYKLSQNDWTYTIATLFTERFQGYFWPLTHLALWVVYAKSLSQGSKLSREGFAVLSLVSLGTLFYLSIFAGLLRVHDYYLIPTLMVSAVTVWYAGKWMTGAYPGVNKNLWFRLLLVAFLLGNTYHAKMQMQNRYYGRGLHYRATEALYDKNLQKYMQEIGLTENKTVLSLPDPSPNITLYLLRRRGATSYGIANAGPASYANLILGRNHDYLVITDPALLTDPTVAPTLPEKVGTYGDVHFFKLR